MEPVAARSKELSLFLIPSLIGIWAFLVPFPFRGETNTFIGHIEENLLRIFHDNLSVIVCITCFAVVVSSLICVIFRPERVLNDEILYESLLGEPVWITARCLSLPIVMLVVWGDYETFGVFLKYASLIVENIAARLLFLAIILSVLAPLLLDFGFVQFVSVFVGPVMRPLFKVPSRSAVDCVASWMGSSSMAVVITAKMHKHRYYSDREAAVMVSSFSLAGIYNIYAVAMLLDIGYAFFWLLLTIYTAMFVIAVILPRIWPLNAIPDAYLDGEKREDAPHDPLRHGTALWRRAVAHGENKARHMTFKYYIRESFWILVPLIFTTIPLMITVGSFLMLVAEWTPVLNTIAEPLTRFLDFFQAPEASIVGQSAVLAFIDHYLAVALGRQLFTEQARFLCVALTTVGLLNMTEVGLHIWHSSIPLKFWQMVVIYSIRVLVGASIIVPFTNLLFSSSAPAFLF